MKTEGASELERALLDFANDFRNRFQGGGLRAVAEKHRAQTLERFKTKTDPSGKRWKVWSPGYAKTRGPQHSLLESTGALLRSLEKNSIHKDGNDLEFGTAVPYALGVQQDEDSGAEKRPFLGIEKRSDIDELQEELDRWLGRTLKSYGLA